MHRSNQDEPASSLWSEKEGRPLFTAMMSRTRFTGILKFLGINKKANRAQNQATYQPALFHDFWPVFEAQLLKFYIPERYLCVEGRISGFHWEVWILTFSACKLWHQNLVVCEAESTYILKGGVYLGDNLVNSMMQDMVHGL